MSYYRLHIHAGAAISRRKPVIRPEFDQILRIAGYEYLEEIGCRPLAFGASDDHFHVFYGLHPRVLVSASVEGFKRTIGDKLRELGVHDAGFQKGHWAVSVSSSGIRRVVAYVENQRERHRFGGVSLEDEWKREFI
jgi:REP element-mobilizing transposase RayT